MRIIWRDCERCGREFSQPDDPGRKRRFCADAEQARRRAEEQARQRQREEQARRARQPGRGYAAKTPVIASIGGAKK